jgi:hypothetical protein
MIIDAAPFPLGQQNKKASKGLYDIGAIKRAGAADGWQGLVEICRLPPETSTKEGECPKCGGKSRCNLSRDGQGGLICSHGDTCGVQFGDAIETVMGLRGVDKGEAIRLLAERYNIQPNGQPKRNGVASKPTQEPKAEPAALSPDDAELRHRVYEAIGKAFGLSDGHREYLQGRGLSDYEIEARGYWTIPKLSNSMKVMKALQEIGIQTGDLNKVARVAPGVCPGGSIGIVTTGHENIGIPTRDTSGRITGVRVRNTESGDNRYLGWFTSPKCSSGVHCHLSRPLPGGLSDSETLRITEGELKADFASDRQGIATLSIPGVTSWRAALPVVEQLKPKLVRLSFDADCQTNPAVAGAVINLWDALTQKEGIEVAVETWPEDHKGIDDAIAAGAEITIQEGDQAAAFVESLRATFPSKSETETPKAEPYFRPITAAELDDGDFKLNYLIPGVICERQPLIIAGQFKTLKTSVAFDAAVSIASGTPFLNYFPVPEPRKVMVLTAESGMATVQETCRRICRSRDKRLRDTSGLYFDDRVPRLDNPDHVNELVELLQALEIEVLIADPAYLMIDGADAGNLFNMGSQLKVFSEIATAVNATPILLHHAKKNNVNAADHQPLELVDLAWAGFAEFARQWLLLSRRERYAEGSGLHELWMSAGGSAGHNGCWAVQISEGHPDNEGGRVWDVSIDQAQDARERLAQKKEGQREAKKQERERAAIEANRQKVRSAFMGFKQLTMKQIRERGGLNTTAAANVTAYMLRVGELLPCGLIAAANGQKYDGYELNYEIEN